VEDSTEPVVVVLRVDGKIMGAVVDGVSDVVHLGADQIQDPPEFTGTVRREYLRGLSRHDQDMLILLELDRLLAPETAGYAV
jgi:purine-binding chemotaxis protein CheW